MKERPILFSGPMVRAILEGRKTQTRRTIKPTVNGCIVGTYTEVGGPVEPVNVDPTDGDPVDGEIVCPYGWPGDRLWVRERFRYHYDDADMWDCIQYYADGSLMKPDELDEAEGHRFSERCSADAPWRPSIHMPRWASRITLSIIGIRVERLNDISEEDARAEGVDHDPTPLDPEDREDPREVGYPSASDMAHHEATKHRRWFGSLWEQINGQGSWDANPWVWVVEFQRMPNTVVREHST